MNDFDLQEDDDEFLLERFGVYFFEFELIIKILNKIFSTKGEEAAYDFISCITSAMSELSKNPTNGEKIDE